MINSNWHCITGGSEGLGFSLVENLLDDNLSCIVLSRTISEQLKNSTSVEFAKKEGRFIHISCDVSNSQQVEKAFSEINSKVAFLNAVIHCAGVYGSFGSILDLTYTDWQKSIEINLNGTFNVLKSTVKTFVKQGNVGYFVGLSGGGATNPMPRILSYAAAKTAQVRLIESVAKDYESTNMRFIAIAPGIMKTKMLDEVILSDPKIVGDEIYSKMLDAVKNNVDSKSSAIELIRYFCSGNLDHANGRLISAVWDDWSNLNESSLFNDQNLFRLRRIVE